MGGSAGDPVATYRETVGERLRRRGFAELDASPEHYDAAAFHDRGFELWKFGLVDTVVVVAGFGAPAPRAVAEFSSRAFEFGLDRKSRLPRGLGGNVVVYAVAACRDPSPELREWVTGHKPSHWGAFEFPVVADLREKRVHYYTSTPLWGGVYYRGFRKTASAVFDPAQDPDVEGL